MIRSAKDLSSDQKAAAEILLGRHILDYEAISVRPFQPAALSEQRRQQIADGPRHILQKWRRVGGKSPTTKRKRS